MSTKTRFEKEAKGNSEMGYYPRDKVETSFPWCHAPRKFWRD